MSARLRSREERWSYYFPHLYEEVAVGELHGAGLGDIPARPKRKHRGFDWQPCASEGCRNTARPDGYCSLRCKRYGPPEDIHVG